MAKEPGDAPDKAGVRSLSQKMDSSRHDFEQHPASGKRAGAFGREEGELNALESDLGEPSTSKQRSLERMKGPQQKDASREVDE